MKTFPVSRDDGTIRAFEISGAWVSFRPLYSLLRSVEGVADIKRNRFNEFRITFSFHDEPMAIWEPFGDNSRYLITAVDDGSDVDLTPLLKAFQDHKGPIARFLTTVRAKAER